MTVRHKPLYQCDSCGWQSQSSARYSGLMPCPKCEGGTMHLRRFGLGGVFCFTQQATP